MRLVMVVAVLVLSLASVRAQEEVAVDSLHRPLDELLDLYVRDGFVYYGALRSVRAQLDAYVASLDQGVAAAHARGSRAQQLAFWINAYNALVLRTVVDRYPIGGQSRLYPASSIRQIAGAFERLSHRVAGRSLTLDAIERDILTPLGDPRVLLALGRGAVGGGRLRSEAYDATRVEQQLASVAAESLTRKEIAHVDTLEDRLVVSPLFSWREQTFVSALSEKAASVFKSRSPLERAVLALIGPHLVTSEAESLEKNTFRLEFADFDWRLNDLGARPPG
ncbi:MAG: DUF547 domain-containing protein [Acidobacteriota bacterium]